MTDTRRPSFSLVGIGAAACIACCAGPILAFLGGLTLAGVATTAVIGTTGLVLSALALVGVLVRQRRATASCRATPSEPVAVAAPTHVVRTSRNP